MNIKLTGLPDGQWLDLNTVGVAHKTSFHNGHMSKLDGRDCVIVKIHPCKTKCLVLFDDGKTALAYNTDLKGNNEINNRTKKSPMEKMLPKLKAEIAALEKWWNRIDHMSGVEERQREIVNKMEQLQGMIAFIKDYLVWKEKK